MYTRDEPPSHGDAEKTPISEIVTYEAATVARDAGVETAVRMMSERGFSGEAALGLTPDGWIDALEAQYDRVRATLRA